MMGVFLFHIPSTLQRDTLIISVIGYDHFKSVVGAIADKENIVQSETKFYDPE